MCPRNVGACCVMLCYVEQSDSWNLCRQIQRYGVTFLKGSLLFWGGDMDAGLWCLPITVADYYGWIILKTLSRVNHIQGFLEITQINLGMSSKAHIALPPRICLHKCDSNCGLKHQQQALLRPFLGPQSMNGPSNTFDEFMYKCAGGHRGLNLTPRSKELRK